MANLIRELAKRTLETCPEEFKTAMMDAIKSIPAEKRSRIPHTTVYNYYRWYGIVDKPSYVTVPDYEWKEFVVTWIKSQVVDVYDFLSQHSTQYEPIRKCLKGEGKGKAPVSIY